MAKRSCDLNGASSLSSSLSHLARPFTPDRSAILPVISSCQWLNRNPQASAIVGLSSIPSPFRVPTSTDSTVVTCDPMPCALANAKPYYPCNIYSARAASMESHVFPTSSTSHVMSTAFTGNAGGLASCKGFDAARQQGETEGDKLHKYPSLENNDKQESYSGTSNKHEETYGVTGYISTEKPRGSENIEMLRNDSFTFMGRDTTCNRTDAKSTYAPCSVACDPPSKECFLVDQKQTDSNFIQPQFHVPCNGQCHAKSHVGPDMFCSGSDKVIIGETWAEGSGTSLMTNNVDTVHNFPSDSDDNSLVDSPCWKGAHTHYSSVHGISENMDQYSMHYIEIPFSSNIQSHSFSFPPNNSFHVSLGMCKECSILHTIESRVNHLAASRVNGDTNDHHSCESLCNHSVPNIRGIHVPIHETIENHIASDKSIKRFDLTHQCADQDNYEDEWWLKESMDPIKSKIDQKLVLALHNLSELLHLHFLGDSYRLNEEECALLEDANNIIQMCLRKNAERERSLPEQEHFSHVIGSHPFTSLTNVRKAVMTNLTETSHNKEKKETVNKSLVHRDPQVEREALSCSVDYTASSKQKKSIAQNHVTRGFSHNASSSDAADDVMTRFQILKYRDDQIISTV